MILLECPNCGARNISEFRFGGERNARPTFAAEVPDQAWLDYVYMRTNVQGVQVEWWRHSFGCGLWFLAERHTKTNQVLKTYRWPHPRPYPGFAAGTADVA